MNLKGDLEGLVEGVIIECSNHIGRGKLVTALIQRGTLRKGCLLGKMYCINFYKIKLIKLIFINCFFFKNSIWNSICKSKRYV